MINLILFLRNLKFHRESFCNKKSYKKCKLVEIKVGDVMRR